MDLSLIFSGFELVEALSVAEKYYQSFMEVTESFDIINFLIETR